MRYLLKVTKNNDGSAMICLPQDVVAAFGDRIYICLGKDHSLRLYHLEQWKSMQERIQTMSLKELKMLRHVLSFGEVKNIQDRILTISAKLAAYAGIQDNVELVMSDSADAPIVDIVAM